MLVKTVLPNTNVVCLVLNASWSGGQSFNGHDALRNSQLAVVHVLCCSQRPMFTVLQSTDGRRQSCIAFKFSLLLSWGCQRLKSRQISRLCTAALDFPETQQRSRGVVSLCFDCALVLLQVVYDFVDSLEQLTSMTYSLATTFPKVIYGPDKLQQTISQLNLEPQAAMLVQPHDDD